MALDERLERAHLVWRPIGEISICMLLVETATIVARRPQRWSLQRPAAAHKDGNAWLLSRESAATHSHPCGRRLAAEGTIAAGGALDGCCLYKQHTDGDFAPDWTPDEVRALKAFIESHQSKEQWARPCEIKLGGRSRSDDWEQDRALMKALAKGERHLEFVCTSQREMQM